jgi:hypothetical protein
MLEHLIPILGRKVHAMQANAQPFGDGACISQVRGRCTIQPERAEPPIIPYIEGDGIGVDISR